MSAPKTAVGASLTAVVVLIAVNGSAFFASLSAGWEFASRVLQQMPLGLSSFLLGMAVGVATMGFLRRFIPESKTKRQDLMHFRLALIELISMAAAYMVVWVQNQTLLGGILAVFAALLVSVIYRLIAAIGSAVARRVTLG